MLQQKSKLTKHLPTQAHQNYPHLAKVTRPKSIISPCFPFPPKKKKIHAHAFILQQRTCQARNEQEESVRGELRFRELLDKEPNESTLVRIYCSLSLSRSLARSSTTNSSRRIGGAQSRPKQWLPYNCFYSSLHAKYSILLPSPRQSADWVNTRIDVSG